MAKDDFTRRSELARFIAGQVLGDIKAVIHQPFGHAGVTFEVIAASGDYILKTSTEPHAFKFTAKNIKVLSALGIPTLDVLSQGWTDSVHFLLAKKIPGRDLGFVLHEMSKPQISKLARQIVEIQRKVGTLPTGRGYGWSPIGVQAPFSKWTDIVMRDGAAGGDRLLRRIEAFTPYLDSVEATCFLDDITMKNVIIDGGELRGIVDLDFVCFGDPMYMLALTETTAVLDVGFDALFYGQELRRFWELSEAQCQAAALYNAVHASQFLSRSDLSADARARMAQWLATNYKELDSATSDPR